VAIVVDDRPTMRLYPPGLPWLHKPAAVDAAAALIEGSARDARCRTRRVAAVDPIGAVRELALPATSFVFVVSDFLVPPDEEAWAEAAARGLDLVPVVVQDPDWEQSFPAVGGCVLPVADPATGAVRPVRLTRR